jgi:hypothetical protein
MWQGTKKEAGHHHKLMTQQLNGNVVGNDRPRSTQSEKNMKIAQLSQQLRTLKTPLTAAGRESSRSFAPPSSRGSRDSNNNFSWAAANQSLRSQSPSLARQERVSTLARSRPIGSPNASIQRQHDDYRKVKSTETLTTPRPYGAHRGPWDTNSKVFKERRSTPNESSFHYQDQYHGSVAQYNIYPDVTGSNYKEISKFTDKQRSNCL